MTDTVQDKIIKFVIRWSNKENPKWYKPQQIRKRLKEISHIVIYLQILHTYGFLMKRGGSQSLEYKPTGLAKYYNFDEIHYLVKNLIAYNQNHTADETFRSRVPIRIFNSMNRY